MEVWALGQRTEPCDGGLGPIMEVWALDGGLGFGKDVWVLDWGLGPRCGARKSLF